MKNMRRVKEYELKIGQWLHTVEGIFEVVDDDPICHEVILREVGHIAEDADDTDTYLDTTSWTLREIRQLVHSDTGIWYDVIRVVR